MHKLRISALRQEPNQNISIDFDPVEGTYPAYKAGQFLTLIFTFDEREIRRSYSFKSSPYVDEPLSIAVKRVDNGEISRFLHHKIETGQEISVLEPQGLFVYEPVVDTQRTVFLFAAGIGITPLFSILKTALVAEVQSKVVLVYSNSSPEQTPFLEELDDWQKRYPSRFHIIWVFSNSKNLMKARLNRDFIYDILGEHVSEQQPDTLFFTCGPVIYMDLCRFTLVGMGYPEHQIRRETFLLPENEEDDDDETEKIVDETSYDIFLNFQGQSYPLTIPYNKSILDVGLEHKIKLPYSCKSGMCSTCISQCSKGHVRMDYNEILTDREVDNGRILLCTGHPTEDGTVIDVL
ncbi:ferredoxin--NADP reductase [Sphingobacterium sp. SYP-B4668]|uniref:ferredoxin--NADP reductase n=1 Tax=Sphingobacterium sp. SYP-B4668 TaxID=2996035 RepID=UPI0005324659|nr:ferredoxin--NADP reductase [Sphingobacterium sp. SYP-B4668]